MGTGGWAQGDGGRRPAGTEPQDGPRAGEQNCQALCLSVPWVTQIWREGATGIRKETLSSPSAHGLTGDTLELSTQHPVKAPSSSSQPWPSPSPLFLHGCGSQTAPAAFPSATLHLPSSGDLVTQAPFPPPSSFWFPAVCPNEDVPKFC